MLKRGERILSSAQNLEHVAQAHELSDTRFFSLFDLQPIFTVDSRMHPRRFSKYFQCCLPVFFAKVLKVTFWRCVGRCEAYSILLESQSLEAHTLFFVTHKV